MCYLILVTNLGITISLGNTHLFGDVQALQHPSHCAITACRQNTVLGNVAEHVEADQGAALEHVEDLKKHQKICEIFREI